MKISIVVYGSPQQSQGAWSAYRFARAALRGGHSIYRIFFYHDGVWNGSNGGRPAQDEADLVQRWSDLAGTEKIDLVICISAARRRGIFDQAEASRYGSGASLADGFELSGLGQYTDALLVSDRLITFGD